MEQCNVIFDYIRYLLQCTLLIASVLLKLTGNNNLCLHLLCWITSSLILTLLQCTLQWACLQCLVRSSLARNRFCTLWLTKQVLRTFVRYVKLCKLASLDRCSDKEILGGGVLCLKVLKNTDISCNPPNTMPQLQGNQLPMGQVLTVIGGRVVSSSNGQYPVNGQQLMLQLDSLTCAMTDMAVTNNEEEMETAEHQTDQGVLQQRIDHHQQLLVQQQQVEHFKQLELMQQEKLQQQQQQHLG